MSKAVALGYGKRHDRPKKIKYPFDAISPLGQPVIADNLDWVVADLEQEKQCRPQMQTASEALSAFKERHRGEMTTQVDVCWMRDHFPELKQDRLPP